MNQTRVVVLIHFLSSFVTGIYTVVLPLMMKDRYIDIVSIGFIYASTPIIIQLLRMSFAFISDFWGRKIFFALSGTFGFFSSIVYSFAHTPSEFVFGKAMEGTKNGSLLAVSRAFLLEKGEHKWKNLVYLGTVSYVAYAVGTLLAGFLIVRFFYGGPLLLSALVGAFVVPLSFYLVDERKKKFSMSKAIHLLDFRKKDKVFKIFMILFFVAGLSFGFQSGFVFPLLLDSNGFDAEAIGLIFSFQILLAGFISYVVVGKIGLQKLILLSGLLTSGNLIVLGFSSYILAGILIIVYGMVEGLRLISHEGIISQISHKDSYGTDIGLLMLLLYIGSTLSLAVSGILISLWGFIAPLFISALVFPLFYVPSYYILKRMAA